MDKNFSIIFQNLSHKFYSLFYRARNIKLGIILHLNIVIRKIAWK